LAELGWLFPERRYLKKISPDIPAGCSLGFAPQKREQNSSFPQSQNSVKPSKISPPPQNAIDIALRGMAIPGESLIGLTRSFARENVFDDDEREKRQGPSKVRNPLNQH